MSYAFCYLPFTFFLFWILAQMHDVGKTFFPFWGFIGASSFVLCAGVSFI